MTKQPGSGVWSVLGSVITVGVLGGCSGLGAEPPTVMSLGARSLRCQRSEVETVLHRESAQVREYYVGCDFMYTRVLCNQADECHPARPQPPCFGGGCFKEDPVTFEWELDETLHETLASADPAPAR